MKRKEVKILGLSYSQSQVGSYVLVLSEKKGRIKLPIIIKPAEAQSISLGLEGIKSSRPSTYDLVKSFTDAYDVDVQEVFIYSLAEGVFYTKIVTSNGMEEIELPTTVADGVILSIKFDCPVFVSVDILTSAGVLINDDGSPITDEDSIDEDIEDDDVVDSSDNTSIENLEKMLEKAILDEEYEIAAVVRDRIDQLKK